jgi:putative tricarboxylic transport membrane protein
MENFLQGFLNVIQPLNLFGVALGVVCGLIVGILPGIGSAGAVAIMIPITFWMGATAAISTLAALYCASMTGCAISAILFRIPGEPASAVTCIDGYAMAKKGLAGKALGISISGSVIGGLFSVGILMLVAPPLANVAISFGPPEFFALACFGLSVITSLGLGNQLKAIICALLGIWFTTVGVDPVLGMPRFTFGSAHLLQGINYVPALIGIYGVSEILQNTETLSDVSLAYRNVKTELATLKEIISFKWLYLYSCLIGTFFGILPGMGATPASIFAYSDAQRFSKHPEKFGTGIPEGVLAPETANNAATGGAMIPTLTLGIPGSSTTAVILAAMLAHGVRPGYDLFTKQGVMVNTIYWAMIFANILMAIGCLVAIRLTLKCMNIPRKIINPIILLLCGAGAFGINNSIDDVYMAFGLGLVGYLLEHYKFPLTPMVLGMILGQIAEISLSKTLILTGNDFFPIFTRPISGSLMVAAILSLFYPYVRDHFLRKRRMKVVEDISRD